MPNAPKSLSYYLDKITSEHIDKPKFVATLSAFIQPFVDAQAMLYGMVEDFDLDSAVGVQEDAVGVRVGRNRFLEEPLNVYFSFDTEGLGWDQGVWFGPGDAIYGLTVLPDDPYRILLRAVIAANVWDGTVEGAYAAWDTLFADTGFSILIQDYGDTSLGIALIGTQPDAVTRALFTTGELSLKPAAMKLIHFLPSVYPGGVAGGTPLFGFDVENEAISGWDVGAWALEVSSE